MIDDVSDMKNHEANILEENERIAGNKRIFNAVDPYNRNAIIDQLKEAQQDSMSDTAVPNQKNILDDIRQSMPHLYKKINADIKAALEAQDLNRRRAKIEAADKIDNEALEKSRSDIAAHNDNLARVERIRDIQAEHRRNCERISHEHGYTIAKADAMYHEEMLDANDIYHKAMESVDKK